MSDFVKYDPKNMTFRRLGSSGLRVSTFSYGGWLTLGGTADADATRELMSKAFSLGINMFDTAEVYSSGNAEVVMGKAVRDLKWDRSEVVLVTKIFFGTNTSRSPNAKGLSRKHIIEGTMQSLERAGLDYWDVVLCHRPDPTVPMEEIVRAYNFLIDQGKIHYWGGSEWSAQAIQEAITVSERLGLIAPIADQPQYSMLHREKLEKEFAPLYKNYSYGTTIWSPLASGLLTGKYNDGIPSGSRFDTAASFFNDTIKSLQEPEGRAKIQKVRDLTKIAEELGTKMSTLALAWTIHNPNVSTCILGATKPEQLEENVKALDIVEKLTPEVMERIEKILNNKPVPVPTYGR